MFLLFCEHPRIFHVSIQNKDTRVNKEILTLNNLCKIPFVCAKYASRSISNSSTLSLRPGNLSYFSEFDSSLQTKVTSVSVNNVIAKLNFGVKYRNIDFTFDRYLQIQNCTLLLMMPDLIN